MDGGFKNVLIDTHGNEHLMDKIKKLPENCIKFTCAGCGKKILGDARFQDVCRCP